MCSPDEPSDRRFAPSEGRPREIRGQPRRGFPDSLTLIRATGTATNFGEVSRADRSAAWTLSLLHCANSGHWLVCSIKRRGGLEIWRMNTHMYARVAPHVHNTLDKKMARKPGTRTSGDFILFDVFYEDGTQRSNRKVPSSALGGADKDEPARGVIEEQDAVIAEKSGVPRAAIKGLRRAGTR